MFDNLGVSLPLVNPANSSCLRSHPLNRLPTLPNVPAIAETLPGFEAVAWYGIVAPPEYAQDVLSTRSIADVNEALHQRDVQDHLKKLSAEIFGGSVEKASKYMHEEVDRWRQRDQSGRHQAAVAF